MHNRNEGGMDDDDEKMMMIAVVGWKPVHRTSNNKRFPMHSHG